MACQIIYGKTSKAGSDTSQSIFIDKGKIGCIIYCRKVIIHTLSGPVTANSLVPFTSKSGQTTAVGCYDHITMRSHNLEIPAVTPELAYGTLWSSFAEKQGRVFLVGVKVRRQDKPHKLFLAICRLDPALLNLTQCQLVKNMFVLKSNLSNR